MSRHFYDNKPISLAIIFLNNWILGACLIIFSSMQMLAIWVNFGLWSRFSFILRCGRLFIGFCGLGRSFCRLACDRTCSMRSHRVRKNLGGTRNPVNLVLLDCLIQDADLRKLHRFFWFNSLSYQTVLV